MVVTEEIGSKISKSDDYLNSPGLKPPKIYMLDWKRQAHELRRFHVELRSISDHSFRSKENAISSSC